MRFRNITQWFAVVCASVLALAACPATAALVRGIVISSPSGMHFQMASADVYSDTANAKEEIRQAILKAASEHKRVILDFGGNWCGDCKVLNIYFHDPRNASLLAANYVLVDVSVGQYDRNLDLAKKYGIPLNKGVPALVVLDGSGRVVYAQQNGEFEAMRKLDSSTVTAFLQKWKPHPIVHRYGIARMKSNPAHVSGN
jgi:thioredoxin 1